MPTTLTAASYVLPQPGGGLAATLLVGYIIEPLMRLPVRSWPELVAGVRSRRAR
jgi:hypothetical protein